MNAKEIIKNKFWIVEDKGVKFGTISLNEDQYILSTPTGTKFYNTETQLTKALNTKLSWTDLEITEISTREAHGYATNCAPFNPMYDVKRKLPLFTKSDKSKSLYCAGYYIIQFEKGWVKSFCPKLITVERYITKGPFKSEIEMRQELSRVNR
jgi:hypothetical protein|tara:strand:+ start:3408 stop:3866 length:459 start_codon:yes stop_codon:yes gene_type:complete